MPLEDIVRRMLDDQAALAAAESKSWAELGFGLERVGVEAVTFPGEDGGTKVRLHGTYRVVPLGGEDR
jgi:hypothetical protein